MLQQYLTFAFLARTFSDTLTIPTINPGFKEITMSVFGFVANNMQTERSSLCPILHLLLNVQCFSELLLTVFYAHLLATELFPKF